MYRLLNRCAKVVVAQPVPSSGMLPLRWLQSWTTMVLGRETFSRLRQDGFRKTGFNSRHRVLQTREFVGQILFRLLQRRHHRSEQVCIS
jgi:hypothetical protein